MLENTAIALVILWLLGLVSGYTVGGYIHVFLLAAVILILARILRSNRPLA